MAKTIDVDKIINGLQDALKAASTIAPIAAKFEVVAPIATIVISAISIAQNILARVEEGREVLASKDEAAIRKILEDLQAINDKLNEAITES